MKTMSLECFSCGARPRVQNTYRLVREKIALFCSLDYNGNMIDWHVHLRDWTQSEKETIFHAASLAAEAGFTALFDMPNTAPPLVDAKTLEERIVYGKAETAKACGDLFYGVYAGVTANEKQITEVVQFAKEHFPDCVGLKMFAGHSTGNMGLVHEEEQMAVYQTLAKLRFTGLIAVHCEKESYIHSELFDIARPETHSEARPEIAEVQSISDQIRFVRESGFAGHLHICHISTEEGLNLVSEAKSRGVSISCGATAHHALLNTDAYHKSGVFAKMNPPLRNEKNRLAIFSGLLSGAVDTIESDHAPHTVADKQKGASGVPGFAGTLRLINALHENGIGEFALKNLCGGNINKIIGTSFKIQVPSSEIIESLFQKISDAYPYNIF